ncbi:hypothetical protein ABIF64_002184 [Bradyrhizobium japonicum]
MIASHAIFRRVLFTVIVPKKRGNYSNYLLFKRNFSAAKLLQSLRFWMICFIILTTRLFERSSRLQQRSRPMTRPPLPGASRRTSDNAVSERGPNRAPSAFQEGKMAQAQSHEPKDTLRLGNHRLRDRRDRQAEGRPVSGAPGGGGQKGRALTQARCLQRRSTSSCRNRCENSGRTRSRPRQSLLPYIKRSLYVSVTTGSPVPGLDLRGMLWIARSG